MTRNFLSPLLKDIGNLIIIIFNSWNELFIYQHCDSNARLEKINLNGWKFKVVISVGNLCVLFTPYWKLAHLWYPLHDTVPHAHLCAHSVLNRARETREDTLLSQLKINAAVFFHPEPLRHLGHRRGLNIHLVRCLILQITLILIKVQSKIRMLQCLLSVQSLIWIYSQHLH